MQCRYKHSNTHTATNKALVKAYLAKLYTNFEGGQPREKNSKDPLTAAEPGAEAGGLAELWYAILVCTELWS